jgi:hypothetical protein
MSGHRKWTDLKAETRAKRVDTDDPDQLREYIGVLHAQNDETLRELSDAYIMQNRMLEALREEGGTTFGCWCPGPAEGDGPHDPGCRGNRVIHGPKTQAILDEFDKADDESR